MSNINRAVLCLLFCTLFTGCGGGGGGSSVGPVADSVENPSDENPSDENQSDENQSDEDLSNAVNTNNANEDTPGSVADNSSGSLNLTARFYDTTVVETDGFAPGTVDIQPFQSQEGVQYAVMRFVDQKSVEVELLFNDQQSLQAASVREAVYTDKMGSDVYLTNGFIEVVYPEDYEGARRVRLNSINNMSHVVVFHPDDDSLEIIPSWLNEDGLVEFNLPPSKRQLLFGLVEELM